MSLRRHQRWGGFLAVAALIAAPTVASSVAGAATGAVTAVKPYAVPVASEYSTTPILSAGDVVPRTSSPSTSYRMVGIPDGLGARKLPDGNTEVFMNHELSGGTASTPIVGGPAQRGAFVSRYVLAPDGSVISGDRAYDTVYNGDTLVGPAPEAGNTTGGSAGFARFCSGFLGGPEQGLDRSIYFTNEEGGGASTFDGKGGQSVAIVDGGIHILPKLAHFNKENTVVLSGTGSKTVILSTEDGPTTPDSQLYMYVGEKDPSSASVLKRNGLLDGKLYALKVDGRLNEKSIKGETKDATTWTEIANPETLSESAVEAAADAGGAFGFVRIEDGAQNPTKPGQFFFVTTGESADTTINVLGRIYRLDLDLSDPTGPGVLNFLVDGDAVAAAGGDAPFAPDNVDVNSEYLMVQEDGTANSRPEYAKRGRDGSIWRMKLDTGEWTRVASLNPPGRDGAAVGAGVWETSGIIDVSKSFGFDSWLFDVQAHSPTPAPAAGTVEDGQLLLLRPKNAYSLPRPSKGYWAAARDGGIFAFGPDAGFHGSTGDISLNQPIVDLESTYSSTGYWLTASDGGVFAFGDAPFFGSTGDITLNQPIVDLARTPSGKGYWLVAADGGVFTYGDARFLGSTGDIKLNKPVATIVPTASGRGYTLIAEDGGVFTFGDAPFLGSLGDLTLNQPILAGDAMESANGYWLFARDGGVFTFGAAGYYGSAGDLQLTSPIVGGSAVGSDRGYDLVGADGGVFTYGPDAGFFGSTGDRKLNQPVVDLKVVGS